MILTLKERLKNVFEEITRTEMAQNQAQIASDLNYSPQYLTDLTTKKESKITDKFLKKLALFYPVNLEYLNKGTGEPLILEDFDKYKNIVKLRRETTKSSRIKIVEEGRAELLNVPMLEVATRADFFSHFTDKFERLKTFGLYTKVENTSLLEGNIVIEVSENDFMGNQLKARDKVLAEPLPMTQWKYTIGIVAVATKELFTIKRIRENELPTGQLKLYADEERGGFIIVNESEIVSMYKITKIVESTVI